MIDALFRVLFFILNLIITIILRLILLCFPVLGLNQLSTVFTTFFGLLEGAFNFSYFMIGDTVYIFTPIIITLFTIKHIAIPTVSFVRKFFVH